MGDEGELTGELTIKRQWIILALILLLIILAIVIGWVIGSRM